MKGLAIGVIVVALLVGASFYWSKDDTAEEAPVMKTVNEEGMPATEAPKDQTMIGSIKEAMSKGVALRCTYAVGEGEQAVQADVYVNGKSFKTTSSVNGVEMQALSDGKTQYMWMSGNKQGMKFDMACLEKLKGTLPSGSASQGMNPEDYQKTFDMAKNVSCEPAVAVDFSVPTTVTFTDQCALMEQMTQMMPKGYMAE